MKILVTGDRGYIGAVLVPLLLRNNYQVIGIDTEYFLPSQRSHFPANYKKIKKDIRGITENDLKDVDVVIHLGALSNDPMGDIDPQLTEDINYEASVRLAKLSKKAGVKCFLFSSSCSVYGIAKEDILDERSKVDPLTAYAESKIRSEEKLKKMTSNNFCVGLLRNATVYGYSPNFRNDLVVNNLVTCAIALNKIKILSDGTPWRPLIDVRDLARVFVEFLKVKEDAINGEVINVGFNENNFQVRDIVSIIQGFLPRCEVEYTGEHGSDARSYRVNFDKFHKLFPEFKQEWPLERSVKDLMRHLKAENYDKEDFLSGKYTRMVVLKNLINSGKVDNMLYYKN